MVMDVKEAWEFLRRRAPYQIDGAEDAVKALEPLMAKILAGTEGGQCCEPNSNRLPKIWAERRLRVAARKGMNPLFCMNEATMLVDGKHVCALHGGRMLAEGWTDV